MSAFDDLCEVVRRLRAADGCPWDREQTHASLKAACMEEAAEVICGINIYEKTGRSENLKEELGDLLLQVVMHAQIAEEEGLFTMEDVSGEIRDKMIRRHPHVFGSRKVSGSAEVLKNWEEIKAEEKKGKEDEKVFLQEAFEEAEALIERAERRKGFRKETSGMPDYSLLLMQAEDFLQTEPSWTAAMSNISALIMDTLPDLNWAGFYTLKDGILTVGPFQGKPACIHIRTGNGVCGACVERDQAIIVPDVHQFPGHIACDSASKSELVLPIHRGGEVAAVLDLDSPVPDRFREEDLMGLSELAARIEERIRW